MGSANKKSVENLPSLSLSPTSFCEFDFFVVVFLFYLIGLFDSTKRGLQVVREHSAFFFLSLSLSSVSTLSCLSVGLSCLCTRLFSPPLFSVLLYGCSVFWNVSSARAPHTQNESKNNQPQENKSKGVTWKENK